MNSSTYALPSGSIPEELPCCFVVLFAVAAVEGGLVFNGALGGAAGLGIVGDGAEEGAR